MRVVTGAHGREAAIIGLFEESFTASEGADEGALIGGLVRDLLGRTPAEDLRVFCAEEAGAPIGAAVFSRLRYAQDSRRVFLLSPMAVAPGHQRRGVGQALISRALEALRGEGVEVAVTYGDPAYYGRVGFAPITEAQARAPLPLSMPQGWIGQALDGGAMPELRGKSRCVAALNRADIW